jgi:arginine-tRNA-protein transferase
VIRKNLDVEVEVGPPRVDGERLDLHRGFHRERSARVGWEPQEITEEEYARTFLDNIVETLELSYRIEGRLAAVAYVDVGPEWLNSIYCFHHPDHHARSLGTFDVLMEIALARRLNISHLYLGYHIAACRSMAYKAAFRPRSSWSRGSGGSMAGADLPAGD